MNGPSWQRHCPLPIGESDARITLAHGEGARLTRQLLEHHVCPVFRTAELANLPDAAHVQADAGRLAITTDSFVVSPLFFPGGDIGSLAVHGSVNDLAVSGAKPRWLTLSLIIEEGLPLAVLDRILQSVADAAANCSVAVIAGDTKVVPRGAADGIFLNTTGVGELIDPVPPGPGAIEPGDALLVSGPIGRHGIAVMCAREEMAFDPPPGSDTASLIDPVAALRAAVGDRVRAIRDATRGGVSAVLHEWAAACQLTMELNESAIPLGSDIRGACELLGLDPLHVANEGTFVAAVAAEAADDAVRALRTLPPTTQAAWIGQAANRQSAAVTIERGLGRPQPLDEPTCAMLPRIC